MSLDITMDGDIKAPMTLITYQTIFKKWTASSCNT